MKTTNLIIFLAVAAIELLFFSACVHFMHEKCVQQNCTSLDYDNQLSKIIEKEQILIGKRKWGVFFKRRAYLDLKSLEFNFDEPTARDFEIKKSIWLEEQARLSNLYATCKDNHHDTQCNSWKKEKDDLEELIKFSTRLEDKIFPLSRERRRLEEVIELRYYVKNAIMFVVLCNFIVVLVFGFFYNNWQLINSQSEI